MCGVCVVCVCGVCVCVCGVCMCGVWCVCVQYVWCVCVVVCVCVCVWYVFSITVRYYIDCIFYGKPFLHSSSKSYLVTMCNFLICYWTICCIYWTICCLRFCLYVHRGYQFVIFSLIISFFLYQSDAGLTECQKTFPLLVFLEEFEKDWC